MNSKFSTSSTPIKLYRSALSGHSHKVQLMLSLLDIPYETIDLDMANGAHKAPEYLKISAFGQVPAIDDNGTILADSNAIIVYLNQKYNDGYEWYPQDPIKAAEVQRWLSVAAGEIAYGPCVVRLVKLFGMGLNYEVAKNKTEILLAVLESTLANKPFLVGESITLADVAAYTYVSHVPEGGVSLEPFPAINAWLARIEQQRGFIGMKRSPIPTT